MSKLEIDEFKAELNDLITRAQREEHLVDQAHAAVRQETDKIRDLHAATEQLVAARYHLMAALMQPQPTPRTDVRRNDLENDINGHLQMPRFMDGAQSGPPPMTRQQLS